MPVAATLPLCLHGRGDVAAGSEVGSAFPMPLSDKPNAAGQPCFKIMIVWRGRVANPPQPPLFITKKITFATAPWFSGACAGMCKSPTAAS